MTAPAPYKMEREQYKIGADGKPVLDKEVPELKASLDTIRRTAADLIVKIDEKKDKEPKQSKPKKVDTKNLGEAI